MGFYSETTVTTERGHKIHIDSEKGGIGQYILCFKTTDFKHNLNEETDRMKMFMHYKTTVGEAKKNLAELGNKLKFKDLSALDEWSKFFVEAKLISLREIYAKLNRFRSDYILIADDSKAIDYCFNREGKLIKKNIDDNAVTDSLKRVNDILGGKEDGQHVFDPDRHTHNKYAGWADNGKWITDLEESLKKMFSPYSNFFAQSQHVEVIEMGFPQPTEKYLNIPVTFRYKTGYKGKKVTDVMRRAKTDALTQCIYQVVSPRGLEIEFPHDENNEDVTYFSDSNNLYMDVVLKLTTGR